MNRNLSLLIIGISLLAVACSPVSCGTNILLRGVTMAGKSGRVVKAVRITRNGNQAARAGVREKTLIDPKLRHVGDISKGLAGKAVTQEDEGAMAIQKFADTAEYMIDAIDATEFPDQE